MNETNKKIYYYCYFKSVLYLSNKSNSILRIHFRLECYGVLDAVSLSLTEYNFKARTNNHLAFLSLNVGDQSYV